MADQGVNDYSSTSNVQGGRSNSVLELNIKTLDSQTYSLQVDKNITVSLLKEKIANEIGVSVGQQRLIFQGRVLKDDHPLSEYYLENGHTLHLVVRQPTQLRLSTDANSGEANTNYGDNANDGAAIPDSLDTLLEFINHMEETLRQNGYQQLDTSSSNTEGLARADLPSNIRSLPTAEMLSLVMRSVQLLMGGNALAALSHIAGRLEQDETFSDPGIRGQVQSEATQVGLAMQHLGALLLELGRILLALQMGQSPGESYVSVGRAVFISSSGPNPIMFQVPISSSSQRISLFSGGASAVPRSIPTAVGPTVVGTTSRHINNHIHAGTAFPPTVSAVGSQQHSSYGEHRDQDNNTRFTYRGPIDVIPIRNPVAAADPSRPIGFAIFTRGPGLSDPAEFNARRRALFNMQQANQGIESTEHHSLAGHSGANEVTERPNYIRDSGGVGEFSDSLARDLPGTNDSKSLAGSDKESGNEVMGLPSNAKDVSSCSMGGSSTNPIGESTNMSKDSSDSVSKSSVVNAPPEDTRATPLGSGMVGSLECKKQRKQPDSSGESQDAGTSASSIGVNLAAVSTGQQLLQSLLSGSNAPSRAVTDSIPYTQIPSETAIHQDSGNQADVSSAVPQLLESPELDGLLAGISGQTGVGSPNVLRDMFQQFTRNPQLMNTVQQIAQQVDGCESGGQGGAGSSQTAAERQTAEQRYGERAIDRLPDDETLQVNALPVARMIENVDSLVHIYRVIAENAADISRSGGSLDDFIDELSNQTVLAVEFAGMLRRDLLRPGPKKEN